MKDTVPLQEVDIAKNSLRNKKQENQTTKIVLESGQQRLVGQNQE